LIGLFLKEKSIESHEEREPYPKFQRWEKEGHLRIVKQEGPTDSFPVYHEKERGWELGLGRGGFRGMRGKENSVAGVEEVRSLRRGRG
jgi:hypothetical protein